MAERSVAYTCNVLQQSHDPCLQLSTSKCVFDELLCEPLSPAHSWSKYGMQFCWSSLKLQLGAGWLLSRCPQRGHLGSVITKCKVSTYSAGNHNILIFKLFCKLQIFWNSLTTITIINSSPWQKSCRQLPEIFCFAWG